MNREDLNDDIRQISGLTLKGIFERQFHELEEEELEFFKKNILKCYLDKRPLIRKTISNLINTFLRNGGLEMWPEILEVLFQNLESDIGVSMSLETFIIVLEDSGNAIEEKYHEFIQNLVHKLTNYLETTGNNLYNTNEFNSSICSITIHNNLIILVLTTLHIILENCPSIMSENNLVEKISKSLIFISNSNNMEIRYRIGRCWLTIIKLNNDILFQLLENLFNFFMQNLSCDYYEMNFTAGEFFLFLMEEENGDYMKNEKFKIIFENNLKNLSTYFFHFSKLTNNDICGEELENKNCNTSQGKSSRYSKSIDKNSDDDNLSNSIFLNDVHSTDNKNEDEEIFEDDIETYNSTWTLRKCCSKLLDKLSNIFPDLIISSIQPLLETEIQHKDWIIKERSILVLGAIGVGAYSQLKPNLINLITFLINEMTNKNKLVRAISCWTLSRFADFILTESNEDLLKLYLSILLKSFLDNESIVHEAACTSFNIIIQNHKEKIGPYLADILKIVTSIFDEYKGNSLLTLYDCITNLSELFHNEFKNFELVKDLLTCIIKKWYELVNNCDKNLNENNNNSSNSLNAIHDVTSINFFDVLIAIIKSSGNLLIDHFNDFFNGFLKIIQIYKDDKEILCKCLDLVSALCQVFPEQLKNSPNKFVIIELIFNLVKFDNDLGLKQYVLALIGDICKTDPILLKNHFEFIVQILIQNLNLTNKNNLNVISICNNSCWAIGVLVVTFRDKIKIYTNQIINKLLLVISAPKLNKSLAQNVAICLGRLGLINPEEVSKFLPQFIKQFCLSVKLVNDSEEKREAFNGLCQSIIINPNGVLTYFAFFCDAVAQYSNSPPELETLFQKIIISYKDLLGENWCKYFNSFPEKLRIKMNSRFTFLK